MVLTGQCTEIACIWAFVEEGGVATSFFTAATALSQKSANLPRSSSCLKPIEVL